MLPPRRIKSTVFFFPAREKIDLVLCEMHGNPNGKKINGKHKNKNFTKEYNSIILELKKLGLYNNWFYEWH